MKKLILLSVMFSFIAEAKCQWVSTNGPFGGHVYALSQKGNDIFAAVNATIYKSVNSGLSWSVSYASNQLGSISDIAVQGLNIYAIGSPGVLLSTDNGISWTTRNVGLPYYYYSNAIAFNGTDLFIGTNNGLYFSADSGGTWTEVDSGLTSKHVLSLHNNGSFLFAGTLSGIFRSDLNNILWSHNWLGGHYMTGITSSGTTLFAGSVNSIPEMHTSTDNGLSWAPAYSGLGINYINTVTASAGKVYAGTMNGLFSYDFQANIWNRIDTGFICPLVLSISPFGNSILAGVDGSGVYIYSPGSGWSRINDGIVGTDINAITSRNNELFLGTYGCGVISSIDDGNTWNDITDTHMGPVSDIDFFDSTIIAGSKIYTFSGTGPGIYVSSDHGNTWTLKNNGIVNNHTQSVLRFGNSIFAGTNTGLYRSTDTCSSWALANNNLTDSNITAIEQAGNYVFVGTQNGVFYSIDSGSTWNATGMTQPIVCLMIDGSKLYAGSEGPNGIYMSSDTGNTWQLLSSFYAFDIVKYGSSIVACNSVGGVIFSPDSGITWIASNTGLTNTNVLSLGVHNNILFAGTKGGGVFKTTNLTTGVKEIITDDSFEVFPNPSGKIISIRLNTLARGEIYIYNSLGELIYKRKFDSVKIIQPEVNFEKGVYFVTIQIGTNKSTKKLIIN